jgi:hypothetical protein
MAPGLLLLAAVLLLGGCVKIRLTIQLREDGSGRVIEDIEFGEQLVDASRRLADAPGTGVLLKE